MVTKPNVGETGWGPTLNAALDSLAHPRGAWTASTAFAVNDTVVANGVAWRCILAHTSGTTFSADPTKWERYGVGQVLPTAPTAPATDDLWYDKANDQWKRWNGTSWISAGSGTYRSVARTAEVTYDVAYLGDSQVNYGEGYPAYAALLSGQKLRSNLVVSYPGQTSATILTHVTDVTGASPKPNTCVVHAGANDAASGIAASTFIGNIASMVAALRQSLIQPVLVTVPPRTDGAYSNAVRSYNVALARYARSQNIPLVDFYATVVNPTTGAYQTAYDSGDHIHPSALGNKVLGQAVADALTSRVVPNSALLPTSEGAPNLIGGGLFLTDTNLDGIPDGWSTAGAAGLSYTTAADSAFCAGNRWRIVTSGVTAAQTFQGSEITSGYAAGDRMLAVARVRNLPGAAGTNAKLQLSAINYTSSYGITLNAQMTGPLGVTQQVDGIALAEWTVPAGTAKIQPNLVVGGSSSSDGTYDIGQIALYNLTALGVAS